MSNHHQIISISDSWYETWKILKKHFLKILFVVALPMAITYAFTWSIAGSFVFSLKTLTNPQEIFSGSSGFVYFTIIALIIILIAQIWGSIALIVAVIYEKLSFGKIFYKSLEFFGSFILMGLLFFLISVLGVIISYMAIIILAIIMGMLSLTVLQNYFNNLTMIPLLIGGVIYVFFVFAPYFLIDNKFSATVAIRKSYNLVRGFFWPLAIRLIIAYAMISTLVFILNFIPIVGSSLAFLISVPAIVIYIYVLYNNLKPQKNNNVGYSQ